MSHQPGAVLGGTEYLVETRLGQGSAGTVYATHHLGTGNRRAVKVLSSRLADRPDLEARLLQEAQVLSTLCSPHLVRVHEIGRLASGRPFYAMDLLEGETLRQALRRGPLAPSLACGLVAQLLDALDAVHAARVVHRDVKPENIFVRADGFCTLLDFGLLKVLAERGRFPLVDFSTDRRGVPLGTARYLPPEVAGRCAPDERADLYAAGVVLVECLTGSLPLAHLEDFPFLAWVERHGFPPPSGLHETLRPVVARATAKDPNRRYPTAEAFAGRLAWACQRAGIDLAGARPPGAPALTARPLRTRSMALSQLALGALVGGTATIGVVEARRPSSAPIVVVTAEPRPPAVSRAASSPVLPEPSAEPPAEAPVASTNVPPPAPAGPKAAAKAPRGSAAAGQRAALESRVRSGRANAEEARLLASQCRNVGDSECAGWASALAARLEGQP